MTAAGQAGGASADPKAAWPAAGPGPPAVQTRSESESRRLCALAPAAGRRPARRSMPPSEPPSGPPRSMQSDGGPGPADGRSARPVCRARAARPAAAGHSAAGPGPLSAAAARRMQPGGGPVLNPVWSEGRRTTRAGQGVEWATTLGVAGRASLRDGAGRGWWWWGGGQEEQSRVRVCAEGKAGVAESNMCSAAAGIGWECGGLSAARLQPSPAP